MKQVSTASLVGLVALSAWLGAATIVAASVAPAAFAVLPSRTLAGALVGRVMPVIFISGVLVAILATICGMRVARNAAMIRLPGPLLLLLAGCIYAQAYVAPRIERVRASIHGPVEALDASDPLRTEFSHLHLYSVAALGVAMLGAFAAIAGQFRNPRETTPAIYSPSGERVA